MIEPPDSQILIGDCRERLRSLVAGSIRCCVTSPPYYGLRDYGVAGQIGLEKTPDEYVVELVSAFREVRRVLTDDGTLFLNLGDSYANDAKWGGSSGGKHTAALHGHSGVGRGKRATGLKPKDLIGIPWMVAFALRADGWWLRRDIIWAKPNVMPESVTDRPTTAHEYVFLLAKNARYYWDAEAVREPSESGPSDLRKMAERLPRIGGRYKTLTDPLSKASGVTNLGRKRASGSGDGRNSRSVWTMATGRFRGAHFATMPLELAERCIRAGSAVGDTVIDPFGGVGTTACAAVGLYRHSIAVELKPAYAILAEARIAEVQAVVAKTDTSIPYLRLLWGQQQVIAAQHAETARLDRL